MTRRSFVTRVGCMPPTDLRRLTVYVRGNPAPRPPPPVGVHVHRAGPRSDCLFQTSGHAHVKQEGPSLPRVFAGRRPLKQRDLPSFSGVCPLLGVRLLGGVKIILGHAEHRPVLLRRIARRGSARVRAFLLRRRQSAIVAHTARRGGTSGTTRCTRPSRPAPPSSRRRVCVAARPRCAISSSTDSACAQAASWLPASPHTHDLGQ